MKVIRITTATNKPNVFYNIMPTLQYLRIPSKTAISEGIMDVKPYNDKTMKALKTALNKLKVKFSEVAE